MASTKPSLTIATIGQLDHGKSTLTAAITQALGAVARDSTVPKTYESIDAAPDRRRTHGKIIIDTATVKYSTGNRHYTHIDCPVQLDYVKFMITGAAQLDGAILVVSCDDDDAGDEAKEQLVLANQLGVANLVVFINKTDLDGDVQATERQVRDLLSSTGFPGDSVPVVSGSASRAVDALTDNPEAVRGDDTWVDKIHALMDSVDSYIPAPKPSAAGTAASHTKFEAVVYQPTEAEAGEDDMSGTYRVYGGQFPMRGVDVAGTVVTIRIGGDEVTKINPGDYATMVIELTKPSACGNGTRFDIKESGQVVGVGVVVSILN